MRTIDRRGNVQAPGAGAVRSIALQLCAVSETRWLALDTGSLECKADHTTSRRILVPTASMRLPQQGRDQITGVAA